MSETSDCLLSSCLCVKKLIKDITSETYCVRHCCRDTPKRAVHAEGGAESINTDVKSEDTEITDTRKHRHVITLILRAGSSCHRGGSSNFLFRGSISVRRQTQQ